jgi:hypothetical protein
MQAQFCFFPQFFWFFLVGVAIQRLFCFVVFWGWVLKQRECFGFCRVVFFFFPLILVKAFFVLFLFFQCRESGVCKNPGQEERGRIQDLNKTNVVVVVVAAAAAAALTLWLSSGFVFLCMCIATAVQKKKKKGACAFSRAGGRGEGEGGKKETTQILFSYPSFTWVVKERAKNI